MEFVYAIIALIMGAVGSYFVVGGKQKQAGAIQDESHKREAEKILSDAKLNAEKTISQANLKAEKSFSEFKDKQEIFKKEKIKEKKREKDRKKENRV